jgi:hypothetical protein
MAAQVVGSKAHVVNAQLLAGRVLRGLQLSESVVPQHVQEGRLAGIV